MTGPRKFLLITGVTALCAWILVPIYLIALGALGGRAGVFKWPKSVWPTDASLDALLAFLRIEGVWQAALNSLIAAGLTMLLSIALGLPAGYALARFPFKGADAFRLMLLMRAYTKREFEQLLTHSQFRSVRIEETLIGMDIWLEK